MASPYVTLLMQFPNDTLPFIPDDYWRGEKITTGCYNQKHTNIVLLLYESNNKESFPKINKEDLYNKLARWFICETPSRNHNVSTLRQTHVPLQHYQKAWAETYPVEWKFWKPQLTIDNFHYPGATSDLKSNMCTPYRDIIQWDRRAVSLGILPPSFKRFVQEITSAEEYTMTKLTRHISSTLRAQTIALFRKYWFVENKILRQSLDSPSADAERIQPSEQDQTAQAGSITRTH